jgi:hypothetical protein
MPIEINKGIEPFEDTTDFTRGNKERKPWGKGESADQFNIGSEYEVTPLTITPEPDKPAEPPAPEKKFKHKLANGTELEAATVEELASLIEKSLQQPKPVPVEYEDTPAYKPTEFKPKQLSLQEQANILNEWKENPQSAMRKLQEAELGVPLETLIQNLSRAELRELHRAQEIAGVEFMAETESYNPTTTNAKKLTEHLAAKNKPITKKNLIVAFAELSATDKSMLRKVEPDAPAVPDPDLVDAPEPPTIIPSNMGLPEKPPSQTVDAAKFASMSLKQQQEYFQSLKRRA